MTGVVSTTHVDDHGDRFTREALDDMVEQAKGIYVLVGLGHDPRQPPLGRTVSAQVVELEDGEFGLQAESELWEPTDRLEDVVGDGREIPIRDYPTESWTLVYDRSHSGQEDQDLIGEIGSLFGSEPRLELKKSNDSVSVLTIAMGIGGIIGAKFLALLVTDLYGLAKAKIKALIARRRAEGDEAVLRVELVFVKGRNVAVDLFVTNPDAETVEAFLGSGLELLEQRLQTLRLPSDVVGRAVFEYTGEGNVELKFLIRRDGVPFQQGP